MPIRAAAFAVLALAVPAAAQETSADAPAVGALAPTPCAAEPARNGPGLNALFSAANRAGAADLLGGRWGQFPGSGKKSAVAGAVLGSALSAVEAADGSDPAGHAAAPMTPGMGGSRTAQFAAVATTAVIRLAKSRAAPTACAR